MNAAEIRKKFLDFFAARGHVVIPSASLLPEGDVTTLFTGSGMQPLLPFLLGRAHPMGRRLVDSQKSFRAEDIDEVGDNRHTTFFEMLGNWSLGDYFKQEQLSWLFEFLTNEIGLNPEQLYVSVFAGDEATGIPRDIESPLIWKELFAARGIEAKDVDIITEKRGGEVGMQGGRIFYYDAKKNWWSRAGLPASMPAGEPGGPDSEIFYEFTQITHDPKFGTHCHPNCDCGRFMEIGNSVFMEYKKKDDGTFEKLAQRNVDFGGGLERIAAASLNDPDVFNIAFFGDSRSALELASGSQYAGNERAFRVILDHIRAAVFLIADGVSPSNTGRGYVLRRLIRRAVRFSDSLVTNQNRIPQVNVLSVVARSFVGQYQADYPEGHGLIGHTERISSEIEAEEKKFRETLKEGLKELEKMIATSGGNIDPTNAFLIYQTYGFPFELIQEELAKRGLSVDEESFRAEMKKHQDLSRTASAGVFKGGLADTSEQTVKLHTAHHLLLKALQTVLGQQVKQRGSNITSERLRLDFSYDGKMTEDQKKEVEDIVNARIGEDLPVIRSEMPREQAEKLGAEHEFGQKYPEHVSVYSIGPVGATVGDPHFESAFSIEFCGGPHVTHTGQIGNFRIAKEEAVGAGVRRIRGVLT